MTEIWKAVPGWDAYEVSSEGRVRRRVPIARYRADGMLSPILDSTGYMVVTLCQDGRRQRTSVHALVASAFLGPRPAAADVNHLDSDRANNALPNLEYATRAQNVRHGYVHGMADAKGERNGHARLTESDVVQIRSLPSDTAANRREIARAFNVSYATVLDVLKRRTWDHVPTQAAA